MQKETERLRRHVNAEKQVQEELKKEINSLKSLLEESKQGLLAASRLSDQLESSKKNMNALKEEGRCIVLVFRRMVTLFFYYFEANTLIHIFSFDHHGCS